MKLTDCLPRPPFPVVLRRARLRGYWGVTDFDEERQRFIITLHKPMSRAAYVDTLIHEWAHVLCWHAHSECDHDDFFGVAYARCYRAVFGEKRRRGRAA